MKKFLVFLLSLTICFTPTLVFASGIGGWTLSNPVAQGASVLYNGAKNVIINGKNVAKTSTALITPTASQVSKVLARGVAGYALSIAVEQLLGSVDWVLDPANNQIVYTESSGDKTCASLQNCPFPVVYKAQNANSLHSTAAGACQAFVNWMKNIANIELPYTGVSVINGNEYCGYETGNSVNFERIVNPDAIPEQEEQKTLPLEVVANKVISNAEGGDAAAQEATKAAAADIVAEAETDSTKARPIVNQLEANSKTETDESASAESKPKDPAKPESGTDISLEFPVFCGWAPQVCEAAQVVISFPQMLTNWWETSKQKSDSWAKSISDAYTSTKEWFQKEPEKNNEGTQVDVDIPTPFDNSVFSKDRFSVSRQCPVPEQQTISLSGISVNFAFDLKPICSVLELARPALIACSYLYACYIVIGAARNG